MGLMNDLKRYAIAKLKQRRHRRTMMMLNSLPEELKKDIGWTEANRHRK